MVFEFFGRRKRLERGLRKQKKLSEKARRFEGEASLFSSIQRQKQRIKVAKRTKFESSPAFAAIEKFQAVGRKIQKFQEGTGGGRRRTTRKKSRRFKEEPIEQDIFFGGEFF